MPQAVQMTNVDPLEGPPMPQAVQMTNVGKFY